MVLKFISKIKSRLSKKRNESVGTSFVYENLYTKACTQILLADQRANFPEIFSYFSNKSKTIKSMPNLVTQLNLFVGNDGLLRVRSKFDRWKDRMEYSFPIILSKDSIITKLIILDYHDRYAHAGCYSLLSELRKMFYVSKYFSVVKRILKECVVCKRLNERSIKLNQSSYRNFRIDPPTIPYRAIYMDHFGPYFVKRSGNKVKVWVLCLTCMWSRAINLKICYDLSVKEFIRNFQIHIYEFGIPELVISDLGTQLVAGANIVSDMCRDAETKLFFEERGIKPIQFQQYFKGCSAMGAMVESCVKLCKRLIYGAMGKVVLDILDFESIIALAVNLVNKRPIAFREALRDDQKSDKDIPAPITPELLLKGYDVSSLHIIPSVTNEWKPEENSSDKIAVSFEKMSSVRKKLNDLYHEEFLSQMMSQAVDVQGRYKPVMHKKIKTGDIVLLKDEFTKSVNYPMGMVREIITNDSGEVTGAVIVKGANQEIVKRHATSVIPLLSCDDVTTDPPAADESVSDVPRPRPRAAAVISKERTRDLAVAGLT